MRTFNSTVIYDADIATVREVQSDPAFVDYLANKVARKLGGEVRRAVLSDDGNTLTIVAFSAPHTLPSMARRFFPDGVELTLVQKWQEEGATGSYSGTFTLASNPSKFFANATFELIEQGGKTYRRSNGSVKVSIPFVGPMMEGELARQMDSVLTQEAEAVAEFLASTE